MTDVPGEILVSVENNPVSRDTTSPSRRALDQIAVERFVDWLYATYEENIDGTPTREELLSAFMRTQPNLDDVLTFQIQYNQADSTMRFSGVVGVAIGIPESTLEALGASIIERSGEIARLLNTAMALQVLKETREQSDTGGLTEPASIE